MRRGIGLFLLGLTLLGGDPAAHGAEPAPASVSAAVPAHALAMHGVPGYPAGFAHFGYANPDAPVGGELRLGLTGSFDSLHPFIVRGQTPQPPGFLLLGAVFEPLMARSQDEPFTLYGLLAESVEVPADRSSILFTLRSEARWQDGRPVTADDILFTFEKLRDHGRPNHRTYYKKVERAEKLDARRLRFTFRRDAEGRYDREMPLIMGLMPILPRHDWEGRDFALTSLRKPLGSGPYKVTAVEPGRSVTLTRDPSYWGWKVPAQRGLWNFGTVRLDFYRDDSVARQAFLAGRFDLRREPNPAFWATAYNVPALRDGRLALTRFPHQRPEPMVGFVVNTRRALFADPALRRALALAFDFDWVNRALFHGLYRRTQSFFPNAELAATGLPEGREKAVLESVRDSLDPAVLTTPLPLDAEATGPIRERLLQASALLKEGGYRLQEGRLVAPSGAPVTLEVMLSDPVEEKVALEWARALERLGVAARVRTVDSAQAQARLTSFDYDVTVARWFNSLSPGNEQMVYWSRAAADQPGSRNYAGVRDAAVDRLARALPAAASREELVATARALDRVLRHGHYVVPFYHQGADPIAFWASRLAHPATTPLYGPVLESWWSVEGK